MAKPKIKKRIGQPPKGYLTYNEAKIAVQARCIKHRAHYIRWHRGENIQFVPPFPYRYYKEWVSWNDFLNTDTVFGKKGDKQTYRPYWEAVRWLQANSLTTWDLYKAACKEGRVPVDIPRYPWRVYSEYDATVFFNKSLVRKLEIIEGGKYWMMVRMEGEPEGVLWFLKCSRDEVKDDWKVMKVWEYEAELESVVWQVLERMSSEYGEREQRLCSNIAQMLYELDRKLLIVRF